MTTPVNFILQMFSCTREMTPTHWGTVPEVGSVLTFISRGWLRQTGHAGQRTWCCRTLCGGSETISTQMFLGMSGAEQCGQRATTYVFWRTWLGVSLGVRPGCLVTWWEGDISQQNFPERFCAECDSLAGNVGFPPVLLGNNREICNLTAGV